MNTIKIEVSSIPALKIEPLSPSNHQAVVLYHGYASNKERLHFLGEIFAMKGYRVFIPDLPRHGERGQQCSHDKASMLKNFWPVIFEAAEEGPPFLAALKETWAEDCRLHLIGESMGGFIAPAVLARSSLPFSAASINASCSWAEAERIFREQDGRAPLSAEEEHLFSQVDPFTYFSQSPIKPMLLMHGTADQIIPPDAQNHFYENIIRIHQNPHSLITYIMKHGVNHFISYGMIEEILGWLAAKNNVKDWIKNV